MKYLAIALLLTGCATTHERDGVTTVVYCFGFCFSATQTGKVSTEVKDV